jgi:hypothetical protein
MGKENYPLGSGVSNKLPTQGYVHFVKRLLYSVIQSVASFQIQGTLLDNLAVVDNKTTALGLWISGD